MWDAAQYLRFTDERARPFLDLIARVGADGPERVVDLGCGPGNLTALLARRWPKATVAGVDSSPEMIEAARRLPEAATVSFEIGDVRDWWPELAPDVITCNAVLQWVPDHGELVVRWADQLAPGGWLAFQLPGNSGGFRGVAPPGQHRDSPNHAVAAELAGSPRWRSLLADVELNRQAGDPADYVALLARPGYDIDVWETTYSHILAGESGVVEWAKGSTLRPVLAALDEEQAGDFLAEYAQRLRGAYRSGPFGVVFSFRRVFAVARRA